MKRAAGVLILLGLLAGCGGPAVTSGSPTTSTSAATTSATARTTTPPPTTSSAPLTLDAESEAAFIAQVTDQTFTANRDLFSDQLVKSNTLVEAQTDFRFDVPSRTLILAVSSVFSSDRYTGELAFDLAKNFAPLFWGSEVPDYVRPESLPAFNVSVDAASFSCPPTVMQALADRELSQDMFAEQCAI